MSSISKSMTFSERLSIAQHEITCALIVISVLLDRGEATESDWARLTLALQRLRALSEEK